jgi:hypothetical protein
MSPLLFDVADIEAFIESRKTIPSLKNPAAQTDTGESTEDSDAKKE